MKKKYYLIPLILLLPFFFVFAEGDGGQVVEVINNIVDWLIKVGTAVTVLMFVWGGVTFTTGGGDEKKITQAKDILKYAAIGLLVIMGASMITSVIKSFI